MKKLLVIFVLVAVALCFVGNAEAARSHITYVGQSVLSTMVINGKTFLQRINAWIDSYNAYYVEWAQGCPHCNAAARQARRDYLQSLKGVIDVERTNILATLDFYYQQNKLVYDRELAATPTSNRAARNAIRDKITKLTQDYQKYKTALLPSATQTDTSAGF